MSDVKNPLRLRKKHGTGTAIDVTTADGGNLVAAQSVRNALIAAAIIIIIFSVFWISLSELTNRVYPWFTVILGFLLGHGIRLAGRGTDWRFPVIAAASAEPRRRACWQLSRLRNFDPFFIFNPSRSTIRCCIAL